MIKFSNCRLLIAGGSLVEQDLWVQNGRVIDPAHRFWEAKSSLEYACDIVVDCMGCILSPGFIDLQFNGGYGVDCSDPTISEAAIHGVLARLPEFGVTSVCLTLVSSGPETYAAMAAKVCRGLPSFRAGED